MARSGPESRPCFTIHTSRCKTVRILFGSHLVGPNRAMIDILKAMTKPALPSRLKLPALALAFALLSSAYAVADECEDLIRMDGLLSKAKQNCPFSYYAFRFQQQSQVCGEKKGQQNWKDLFGKGAATFDGLSSKMGKDALCNKLLADFPMTVKR